MMREIKFRGKVIEPLVSGEKWIYSDNEMPEVYLNHPDKLAYIDGVPVEYETVTQYTGLKDKNGTEIYEGNVLHLEGYAVMYVEFVDGEFVAKSTNSIQRVNWQPLRLIALVNKGYKVIGNLYEHNHLLGDNK